MCGEYDTTAGGFAGTKGSPPHVWRIRYSMPKNPFLGGITSTCVENTNENWKPDTNNEDHLHMCGEYYKFSEI